MHNFITIFNNMYDKFMECFYKNDFTEKEITKTEKRYLGIIYSIKEITLTKFAQMAKVTKPAATQIVNKFLDKGYVTKRISDKDKRVCYIELTETIKNHITDSYRKLNKVYKECLNFLTDEEINQLSNLLFKINENL